jgi:hypothetical protein
LDTPSFGLVPDGRATVATGISGQPTLISRYDFAAKGGLTSYARSKLVHDHSAQAELFNTLGWFVGAREVLMLFGYQWAKERRAYGCSI